MSTTVRMWHNRHIFAIQTKNWHDYFEKPHYEINSPILEDLAILGLDKVYTTAEVLSCVQSKTDVSRRSHGCAVGTAERGWNSSSPPACVRSAQSLTVPWCENDREEPLFEKFWLWAPRDRSSLGRGWWCGHRMECYTALEMDEL